MSRKLKDDNSRPTVNLEKKIALKTSNRNLVKTLEEKK